MWRITEHKYGNQQYISKHSSCFAKQREKPTGGTRPTLLHGASAIATSARAEHFIAVSLLERNCWATLGGRWEGCPQQGTFMGKFGLAFVTEPSGKLLEKFQDEYSNFRWKRVSGGERRNGDLEVALVCWHYLSCSVSLNTEVLQSVRIILKMYQMHKISFVFIAVFQQNFHSMALLLVP